VRVRLGGLRGSGGGGHDVTSDGQRLLTGWGRTAPTRARVVHPASPAEVRSALGAAGPRGVIARGLGRSYGDAAQNAGGDVLSTRALDWRPSLDEGAGTLTAPAGASLGRLLTGLAPRGWFLPVVPGTRHVTLGGAIASDVHGKNHHRDGSLSRHVRSLVLEAPRGGRLTVAPGALPDVLAATAGGMGLTGVVVEATIALIPIETRLVAVDVERAPDLDAAMAAMEAGDAGYRYSVAWIDCLARGRALGRSVLLRGDHARVDELPRAARSHTLRATRRPPALPAPPLPPGALRRSTVAAFNELHYRRAPARARRIVDLDSFFFPLDALRDWNRMYGPRGFLQYQLVVPFERDEALRGVIERLSAARTPPFLAVLKRFGAEQGPLSFPMPGWTLAVDLAVGAPDLAAVLDDVDKLVAGAGGRVYLAKDARLRPDLLGAMYPRLAEWRATQARLDPDGVMRSDLARRLGLAGAAG
jgi:decaprenylphospho-beta-D-ribofuranose 2-oxidase